MIAHPSRVGKGRRRSVLSAAAGEIPALDFDLRALGPGAECEMFGTLYEMARLRSATPDVLVVPDTNGRHVHRQMIHRLMRELPVTMPRTNKGSFQHHGHQRF